MSSALFGIIFLGVLTTINVVCTIILYPGLRGLIKDLRGE